jgi:endoribonuclease Dicer
MVCIELGLHSLANSSSRQFHQGLAQVLPWHTAMLASSPAGDFWMDLDYPKSLADLIEAIFGAVYVDAEFNLGFVASVFDTLLLPSIQRHLSIDTVVFSVRSLRQRCPHFQYAFAAGPCDQDGSLSAECTVTLNGIILEKATRAKKHLAHRAVCRMIMETLKSYPDALAGVCPCFAS